MATTNNRGRPPRAEAPSILVHIRLSPLELRRAVEAAEVNHQRLGDFIRGAIDEAVDDCLDPLPPEARRRIS